jgi:hypothetical protein
MHHKYKYMRISIVILFSAICFSSFSLHGQSYITAFGFRAGSDYGLSLNQRLFNTKLTVEGILQTSKYKYSGTILLEQHRRLIGKRLNFFYGIGGHTGNDLAFGQFYGVTPIVGMELTVARLNITIDYKPAINLYGREWAYHDSAFSIRYVLIKQPKKHFFRNLFKKKK